VLIDGWRGRQGGEVGGNRGASFRADGLIGQHHLDLMVEQEEQFVIGQSS
jgi:hypothetical protein